jgi:hypothetical protein
MSSRGNTETTEPQLKMQEILLWGSVVFAIVTLYQMYRAQCAVKAASAAVAPLTTGVTPFRNTRRPVMGGKRERLSQGNVPTYLDQLNPTRESQWDLLGATNKNSMAAAYSGSAGLNRADRNGMVSYLESLKGNQRSVDVGGGKSCTVSSYNNCPANLAYQCENNKFWNDNAVSEALALSATGALSVPTMEESQLYNILRFSADGVEPGCSGAASFSGQNFRNSRNQASFRQQGRRPIRGGEKGDLLKLIN